VTFRGAHVIWIRNGQVQWRSSRTFRAGNHAGVYTTISTATATPDGHRLAYRVSQWWGRPRREHALLFIATPSTRERLVRTSGFPLGWTPRGLITADVAAHRVATRAWRTDARPASALLSLTTATWVWDWSGNRLYTVSGGQVSRSDGTRVTPLFRLGALGIRTQSRLILAPLGSGLIELANASHLIVFDGAGRVRTRASLPPGWRLTGAVAAEPGGAVAFEATPASDQQQHVFRLYAALPGSEARLLGTYTAAPSCASHGLSLRGVTVLVTTSDLARLYDVRGRAAPIDLGPAVRWLEARHRTGRPRLL
jgi:hypothetical protein